MRTSFYFLIILLAVALVAIFIAAEGRPQPDQGTDRVAATIFPLADITRAVAGDSVEVIQLIPAGASPHTFDPSPSTLRDLEGASALYAIGYGIDDWTAELAQSTNVPRVVVDRGIVIRETAEAHLEDDHDDEGAEEPTEEEDEHGHGPEDPHYWLTLPNAKLIAETIADDLATRFPEHEAAFQENLDGYLRALDEADAEIRTTFANLEHRNLITLHDAWYYFADEYRLTIVGTFEPSPGREPTPQYLADLTHAIEESGVRTLYSEPTLATDSIDAFVSDNGLTIAVLDPEGLAHQTSYIDLMLWNANVIAAHQ